MMALLPIAVALLILIFRQMHVVLVERETRALCRKELLQAQDQSGKVIGHLLKLNVAVQTAKSARDTAKFAMAAAIATENPVAFAIALKTYNGALRTLDGLRISQRVLLFKANLDLVQGLDRARSSVAKIWSRQQKASVEIQSFQGSFTSFSIPHVAVRPKDANDVYPEYVLEDNFSEKQALQVFWKMSFQHQPTRSLWQKQDWNFHRGCAATLVPRNSTKQTFQARLSEDKFSSKSLFFF